MQMDTARSLLCAILHCGYLDLDLLDNVEYAWEDVLDCIEWENYSFNDVMRAVFDLGIIDIRDAVEGRIDTLSEYDDLDDDEKEELKLLQELDPDNDIESWHNCLDTSVWCQEHGDTYKRYLSDELEKFERMTGFAIEIM